MTTCRVQAQHAPTLPGPVPAGSLPSDPPPQPIIDDGSLQVAGQFALQWQEDGTEILLMRGNCEVRQGETRLLSRQLVLWRTPLDASGNRVQVAIYLEGDVESVEPSRRQYLPASVLDLETDQLRVVARHLSRAEAAPADPVYERASKSLAAHRGPIRRAQYTAPQQGPQLPGVQGIQPVPQGGIPIPAPGGMPVPIPATRHVSIFPRYAGQGISLVTPPPDDTLPREYTTTITGGVRIVVDGVPVESGGQVILTTIDLAADRAVIWTDADRLNEFSKDFDIEGQSPFEVYLEGDIVVRQGLSVFRASHAYYDLTEQRGLLWNGELQTYLPEVETTVRLRARQIRQDSKDRFHASDAWITTSEMGIPGYRIEASDIFLDRRHLPGRTAVDPLTGLTTGGTLWVTSLNNRLFLENVPVASVPYLSSPAEIPDIPVRRVTGGYDRTFGATVKTVLDAEALFGVGLPDEADWDLQLDYFSKRGPAVGTGGKYDGFVHLFGTTARARSEGNIYYIHDDGEDRLGQGRNHLPLESSNRGRALWRNRLDFPFGTTWINEIGYLSDRNVLEQYWEPEWDTGKDYENVINLRHQQDNLTASLLFRTHLQDFENTTDWLPRVDLTMLSENIPGTPLLWSTRSSVGYGRVHPAEAPFNPATDIFTPLPYYTPSEGVVAMTRHEIDLPMAVGPVNVVPYVLGEAAHWNQDRFGDDVSRLYGSAGVRASIMFSRYMPGVYNPILGLNGLAHKMVFDVDYSYSEATESLNRLAQYNEFDEDAQERFRERFMLLEFGGVLPTEFDPRYYAVRSGAGRYVTAPYHELVDDLHVVRLGWRHRWQTRTGPPQAPRIVDWMTLDLETSVFPDDAQNFGETFGLISARYAWNVSSRTRFLANTIFDVFDPGQQVWNVGVLSQRSSRGSIYFGYREIRAGPVDSRLLVGSLSYHPSEKWVWTFGSSFDVAEGIDRGQSATVTRIGEYMLFHFGAGYDRSRDNFGVGVSVEPKFGNYGSGSTQLSSLLGVPQ